MLNENFMFLLFIVLSYYRLKFYIAGIGIFDLSAPVTFTRWPSYTKETRIPWRDILDVQIWSFYVKANKRLLKVIVWQIDRHDHTTPLRGWSKHYTLTNWTMTDWTPTDGFSRLTVNSHYRLLAWLCINLLCMRANVSAAFFAVTSYTCMVKGRQRGSTCASHITLYSKHYTIITFHFYA